MESISQFALDLEVFFRSEEERVAICFHTRINEDQDYGTDDSVLSTTLATSHPVHKNYYEDSVISSSPSPASVHSYLEMGDWSSDPDSHDNRKGRDYDQESETESSAGTLANASSSLLLSSSATPDGSVKSDSDVW
ncbi:Hypothetical protein GLP15_3118 [Giardia lamblia P15]|uniref:Uncharacterized protein n=1 Tax=Giardia intestinalis (strain P15) TaxID=658858 RepID=E1F2R3_GIAIA|nr:Hypothetical protein GLP15_3118 [Giardia lamblia P15]